MTGAGRVSVPAQGQSLDLGGKLVSDLIAPETTISWSGINGTVTGTIKKVDSWPEWGAEEGGHFFPIELDSQYEGEPVTMEGAEVPSKTATDRKWVLKVDEAKKQNKKFTFKVKGETIFTLDFSGSELAE